MVGPLTLSLLRRRAGLRRRVVDIPVELKATDTLFLFLRRMRVPLLALVGVMSVAVVGLSFAPGVDANGNPYRLTMFESFYVMSYTASTIGFGEIPYAFTLEQRLWVTAMIYATVIGWAYAFGNVLSLLSDEGFTSALTSQRFRRRVRHLNEPFHIIAGYGYAGAGVARGLDDLHRRFVVIDTSREPLDRLAASELGLDVPALKGDVRDPAVLGMAGLDHPLCEGVLALTNDDDANLSVVQSVSLLRPGAPVIARCGDATVVREMNDFDAHAVINPLDRYGVYLVLSMQRPVVHQLVSWLTAAQGEKLPDRGRLVPSGRFVVAADTDFRDWITYDLTNAGYEVTLSDPGDREPDVSDAVGFVAGMSQDSTNLAMAAHVRRTHPEVVLAIRQNLAGSGPVMEAFSPDSLFVATDLVARESLARIVTPRTWAFIEYAATQDDPWASEVIARLTERCGPRTPTPIALVLDSEHGPAVVRWLQSKPLTLGDLLRHPEDRDRGSAAVALTLTRGVMVTHLPSDDTQLRAGDELLLATGPHALAQISEVLFNDAAVEYVVTGRRVPSTWLWRKLFGHQGR